MRMRVPNGEASPDDVHLHETNSTNPLEAIRESHALLVRHIDESFAKQAAAMEQVLAKATRVRLRHSDGAADCRLPSRTKTVRCSPRLQSEEVAVVSSEPKKTRKREHGEHASDEEKFAAWASNSSSYRRSESHLGPSASSPSLSSKKRKNAERSTLRRVVHSPLFDALCAFVIATNAIFIGVQVELKSRSHRYSDLLQRIEVAYCGIFVLELLLRMYCEGLSFFRCVLGHVQVCFWNYFDFVIVAVAVTENVTSMMGDGATWMSNVSILRILRMARVLRIIRVIRMVHFFRELRILVASIFATFKSLVWAMVLLVLIQYVFAVIFTHAVSEYVRLQPEHDAESMRTHWGTITRSILTLFKSITGGNSWEVAMDDLAILGSTYQMLFVLYIGFVVFAVMNVMTGVFCQNAIESAQADENEVVQEHLQRTHQYAVKLTEFFTDMNDNCDEPDDKIGYEEFSAAMRQPRMEAYFQTLGLDPSDAFKLFKMLDLDDTGEVDMTEFVDGCLRLRGSAKNIDIALITRQTTWLMSKIGSICKSLDEALDDADQRHQDSEREFARLHTKIDDIALRRDILEIAPEPPEVLSSPASEATNFARSSL